MMSSTNSDLGLYEIINRLSDCSGLSEEECEALANRLSLIRCDIAEEMQEVRDDLRDIKMTMRKEAR